MQCKQGILSLKLAGTLSKRPWVSFLSMSNIHSGTITMRRQSSLILAFFAVLFLLFRSATAAETGFWQNPVIKGEGAVHPLPDAAFLPKHDVTYKAVFSVTKGDADPKKVNGALAHVARAVNLFASAGVPPKHLKFVVIIHGKAVPAVLDNVHYKQKFGVDNPNLKLISELKSAGVTLAVCGQAVAGYKYEYSWVNPEIKVALSALSTLIILQHEGYALLPM